MRFLADENLDGRIFAGIRHRLPDIDIVRVQDTEIYQAPDPLVLEWAARSGRILLTHDRNTLVNDAYVRVRAGLAMPGVIEIRRNVPIGSVIDALEVMMVAGRPEDFADQVRFIPMR